MHQKKYWDMYDRNEIPLPNNRFRPENLPSEVQNSGEIYAYARVSEPEDTEFYVNSATDITLA